MLGELEGALNEIRGRFPAVPVACIPWMNLKHPLHPVQEELLQRRPSQSVLSDTEEQQGPVLAVARRMMSSNSLALRIILCCVNAIRLSVKILAIKTKFRREIRALRSAPFQVIAKTWCFGADRSGDDRDFYYGDLHNRFAAVNIPMLLVCGDANNIDWSAFARAHISVQAPFKLPEMCLSPTGAPLAVAISQIVSAIKLHGYAKTANRSLTKQAAKRASLDVLSPAVTQPALLFHIAKECVRQWNPAAFITLYEGHGWEKAAWWGAKSENPACRTVGYQHTALFPDSLSLLHPFVDESFRSVPDIVLALGRHTAALLDVGHRRHGVTTLPFGTFRRQGTTADAPADPKLRTVLVIPEGILSEMEFLFRFAAQCARTMPSYRFILRAHPKWLPSKALRELAETVSSEQNVVFSRVTIDEDFSRASAMLYRGSSAVLYGILNGLLPVYVHMSQTPVEDPIAELAMWRRACDSPESLSRQLADFESQSSEQNSSQWQSAVEYVRNYIPPVNDRSIGDFLAAVKFERGTQPCIA